MCPLHWDNLYFELFGTEHVQNILAVIVTDSGSIWYLVHNLVLNALCSIIINSHINLKLQVNFILHGENTKSTPYAQSTFSGYIYTCT